MGSSAQTTTPASELLVGGFVLSTDNDLGIGKLLSVNGAKAVIEYFESLADDRRKSVVVPTKTLEPRVLAPETRCYWREHDRWRVGRVIDRMDDVYTVRAPNRDERFFRAADLLVRWRRPLADPTEVALARGFESPYYHNCRRPFVASMARQRSACRGMTGILSAVVELHPHQIEVARRVLEDPLQRYLLADEVGLGKTIEAGFVIRQYLLDDASGDVLVAVPRLLVGQWRSELAEKFLIGDFGAERVRIVEHDELSQTTGLPGLLVVDEAHHLAARGVEHESYREAARLAHSAPRLLLLSATPLLHNEAAFLALLHLLDPTAYDVKDVEGFRKRIAARDELATIFYTLDADQPGFLLREKLAALDDLFPSDVRLSKLTNRATELSRSPDQIDLLAQTVHALRVHVGETYRLHRRLLRNRRTEKLAETFPVRGRSRPTQLVDPDPRRRDLDVLLADLREALAAASGDSLASDATQRFASYMSASADVRSVAALAVADLATTPDVSRSDDEMTALAALRDLDDGGGSPRIAAVVDYLAQQRGTKIAVFATLADCAREIATALVDRVGSGSVATHTRDMSTAAADEAVGRFSTDGACYVLVCDESAEEGRNLQAAEAVVHFDLPWAPNRLEQRLGRFDRFGIGRPVESVVVCDPPSSFTLQDAWLNALVESFEIFDQSLASVQFTLDELTDEAIAAALRAGDAGLRAALVDAKERISSERDAAARQDELDSIDVFAGLRVADAIEGVDADWEGIREAMETWAGDTPGGLRFSTARPLNASNPNVVTFEVGRPGKASTMPLLPWDRLADTFAPLTGRPGSYRRQTATARRCRLFRAGEPFVDALAAFTEWDDRGRTFAFWRERGAWAPRDDLLAFGFDLVLTADAEKGITETEGLDDALAVVLRRSQRFFPPIAATVWVDERGDVVLDRLTLDVLRKPYAPVQGDFNLSQERDWALDDYLPEARYVEVWSKARLAAEAALIGNAAVKDRVEKGVARLSNTLAVEREQLLLRVESGLEHRDQLVAHEQTTKALITAVRDPVARVDAAGLVVISASRPDGPGFERLG